MPSRPEIEEILLQTLQQLEEERRALKKKSNQHQVLLAIGIGVSIGSIGTTIALVKVVEGLSGKVKVPLVVVLIIVASLAIALARFSRKEIEKLRQQFEAMVRANCYPPVLKAWNTNATYHTQQKIPEALFERAQLFTSYNEYKGQDYCKGTLADGRSFQFSTLELNDITRNTDGEKVSRMVFEGVFFVLENVEPLQEYSGQVTITTKKETARFFKRKKSLPPEDNILDADFEPSIGSSTYERQLFDKQYTLSSDSSIDLNEVLSDDFVALMNGLASINPKPITIGFEEGTLYAMFWNTPDFLKWSIQPSENNKRQIAQQVDDFQAKFECMDRLISAASLFDAVARS